MFKEIIEKIKSRTKKTLPVSSEKDLSFVEKEPPFTINILQEQEFLKVEISDYISLKDFMDTIRLIDTFGATNLLCNSVIWNTDKQQVNKGTYFIIDLDDYLYNILINDEITIIDERIKKQAITEERKIELTNNNFWYIFLKHENTATIYEKHYNNNQPEWPMSNLPKEEVLSGISAIISNLEQIAGIENIIDLNILRQCLETKHK